MQGSNNYLFEKNKILWSVIEKSLPPIVEGSCIFFFVLHMVRSLDL